MTIQAPLTGWQNNLNYNLGIFAQDRWTVDRMTLSGGVRLDMLNESTEAFTAQPHRWLPNRNTRYDAVKNVPNWKDINPRVLVRLRPLRQRQDGAQGEREPGRRAGLDPLRRGEQPGGDVRHADSSRAWRRRQLRARHSRRLHSAVQLEHWHGRWRVRRVAVAGFRQHHPDDTLRQRDHGRLGCAAVTTGSSRAASSTSSCRGCRCRSAYFRRIYGNFNVMDNEALGTNDFTPYSALDPDDQHARRNTARRGHDGQWSV